MLLQINTSVKYFGKHSDTVAQKGSFDMNKTHRVFNEIVFLLLFMYTLLFYNIFVLCAKEKVPVL